MVALVSFLTETTWKAHHHCEQERCVWPTSHELYLQSATGENRPVTWHSAGAFLWFLARGIHFVKISSPHKSQNYFAVLWGSSSTNGHYWYWFECGYHILGVCLMVL